MAALMTIATATAATLSHAPIQSAATTEAAVMPADTTSLIFQPGSYDKLYYKKLSRNTVEVAGIDQSMFIGKVIIPAKVSYEGKQYKVVRVGDRAFAGDRDVISITVPATVTEIGDEAFAHCEHLTDVTIQGELEAFGSWVTAYSPELKVFTIAKGKKFVTLANTVYDKTGKRLLAGCSGSSIAKNDGLTIVSGAFAGASFKKLVITSEHITLKADAFKDCPKLLYVDIEAQHYSISTSAFRGCENMKEMRLSVINHNDIGKKLTDTPAILNELK